MSLSIGLHCNIWNNKRQKEEIQHKENLLQDIAKLDCFYGQDEQFNTGELLRQALTPKPVEVQSNLVCQATNNNEADTLLNKLDRLRNHRTSPILSKLFGCGLKASRSAVAAAVLIYIINSVNRHHHFRNCFIPKPGSTKFRLNVAEFKNLLKDSCPDVYKDLEKFIPTGYLTEIEYIPQAKLIKFSENYSVFIDEPIPDNPSSQLVKNKLQSSYLFADDNGRIVNKQIRNKYNDSELRAIKKASKAEAIKILNSISEKIADPKRQADILIRIIFLQEIANLAMRDQVSFKIGYETLALLAEDIFVALDIGLSSDIISRYQSSIPQQEFNKLKNWSKREKNDFLNKLIIAPAIHRQRGMWLKTALLTIPVYLPWAAFPVVILGGMLAGGITAILVLGVYGVLNIFSAIGEGLADIMTYYRNRVWIRNLAGDSVQKLPDTLMQIINLAISKIKNENVRKRLLENANHDFFPELQSLINLVNFRAPGNDNTITLHEKLRSLNSNISKRIDESWDEESPFQKATQILNEDKKEAKIIKRQIRSNQVNKEIQIIKENFEKLAKEIESIKEQIPQAENNVNTP